MKILVLKKDDFVDFALAKEDIDNGIETLAKQQKELQMDKLKADTVLEHLQEETGSLQASTIAFRGELDGATRATAEREADIRGQLQQTAETIRTEAELVTEMQDGATAAVRKNDELFS